MADHPQTATATDNTPLDLIGIWANAERAGDDAAIADVLTDDFRLVGPLGFVLTKEQMGERYRSGDLKHTVFTIQEPALRLYGASAVVIATQEQQTTYRGQDASGRFRITLVATWVGDRWRFASMHLSPIAQPPAAAS